MPPAEIRTERLILRPMRADDAARLMAVFGAAKVMAAFDRGPFDRSEMVAWVERNLEHQRRHGWGLYTIVLRESGEVVGDCGLQRMVLDDVEETELGYDLHPAYWGRGLATEAASAVTRHAFGTLGLIELVSLVREANRRSAAVAERIGMTLAGRLTRGEVSYLVYRLRAPSAETTA